ncbi:MAG: hypothetical protein R2700_11080 [Solirubrobacterales bacterium]
MELLIAIIIVSVVAAWVTMPLRRGEGALDHGLEDPHLADLEARKQAKYREIRDSELDHAQGKLGDDEFARQDAELRREAIAILKEIDAVTAAKPESAGAAEAGESAGPASGTLETAGSRPAGAAPDRDEQ